MCLCTGVFLFLPFITRWGTHLYTGVFLFMTFEQEVVDALVHR